MNKKKISIGIICYNEEPNVIPCYEALSQVAQKEKKYNFEFIFSDNGSQDDTRKKIQQIVKTDKRTKGIFLSRNFGPESNSQAALDQATGDAFILYEGDMQDPPKYIHKLIRKWEEGYDIVVGVRTKIEDTWFMTIVRKNYYRVFKAISDIEVPVDAGSFGLMNKRAMDTIREMPEKFRFYRGLRAWIGFKSTSIVYHRTRRKRGKTSYNILRYIHHAERSLFGFSYLPIDIITYTGFITSLISLTLFTVYCLMQILLGQIVSIPMIILFMLFVICGVQLFAMGIIGKYIQVVVEETKRRPSYIVEKIITHKVKN